MNITAKQHKTGEIEETLTLVLAEFCPSFVLLQECVDVGVEHVGG